jgi:hypothetical protein
MKRLSLGFIAILAVACLSFAGQTGTKGSKGKAFTGEIWDSACAKQGSHEMMEKMEGVNNAKDCTIKCVAEGSKYVLYNPATKTIYELDDQTKPKEFAGQKVTVTGTYDKAAKTIHVEKIEGAK